MSARYKDSKGQPLNVGDIVVLEVPMFPKRLEYVMRDYQMFLSYCWCPLSLLAKKYAESGWKVTKVGNIHDNPDYMKGLTVMYLEPCDDCDDIHYGSVLMTDKALLTEILNKTK